MLAWMIVAMLLIAEANLIYSLWTTDAGDAVAARRWGYACAITAGVYIVLGSVVDWV